MEKYKKIKLVGRGAHGAVFLCLQKNDNSEVILKEIPVDQLSKDERQASMVEAKVLSMLDHPNVIAYYENFLEEKTMVIVMEYAQGGTLFDFLQLRNGKLLDEEVVGTPCYISPELCEGKPYNQKSDIWALGCVLYELMTLHRPFDANNLPALVMKIMRGCFDPVPEIYSKDLRHLLMNMLHLDPNQRPNAAQIMCQPFMINVVYRLYVDVGSLPCINKTQNCSSSSSQLSIISIKNSTTDSNSKSSENKINRKLYFLCGDDSVVLPSPAKKVIKYISLGVNKKIGLTQDGYLITWLPKKSSVSSVHSTSNSKISAAVPSFVASIVDERFAVNIISAACGNDFTICLSDSGVVFTFGKASSGCLTHGTKKDVLQPRIVESLFGHDIVSVACGSSHVLAISEENEVFAWGFGNHGCLGLGKAEFCEFPQLVNLSHQQKPQKVFCGPDCSFIITEDKSLLACGSNRHNKLAMNSEEGHQIDEARVFTQVHSEPIASMKIISVAAANSHTLFLSDNGQVFSVGSNRYSQLGWGKPGLDYTMPAKVERLEEHKVIQITCTSFFNLAVTTENSLYTWGKCIKTLLNTKNVAFSDVEVPELFKNVKVLAASCDSENCLILCEDRGSNHAESN